MKAHPAIKPFQIFLVIFLALIGVSSELFAQGDSTRSFFHNVEVQFSYEPTFHDYYLSNRQHNDQHTLSYLEDDPLSLRNEIFLPESPFTAYGYNQGEVGANKKLIKTPLTSSFHISILKPLATKGPRENLSVGISLGFANCVLRPNSGYDPKSSFKIENLALITNVSGELDSILVQDLPDTDSLLILNRTRFMYVENPGRTIDIGITARALIQGSRTSRFRIFLQAGFNYRMFTDRTVQISTHYFDFEALSKYNEAHIAGISLFEEGSVTLLNPDGRGNYSTSFEAARIHGIQGVVMVNFDAMPISVLPVYIGLRAHFSGQAFYRESKHFTGNNSYGMGIYLSYNFETRRFKEF